MSCTKRLFSIVVHCAICIRVASRHVISLVVVSTNNNNNKTNNNNIQLFIFIFLFLLFQSSDIINNNGCLSF